MLDINRWVELMEHEDLDLTDEELEQGWHFCVDWDGMLIGPPMLEWDSCKCQIRRKIDQNL